MKTIKEWYQMEGFWQFMVGGMWNCHDMRNAGRLILIAMWAQSALLTLVLARIFSQ